MNWKKKALTLAALNTAVTVATATSAFAEGTHYKHSQGAISGHRGACAYNWVQADTQGFPGWHGKHVFVTGITYNSAMLQTPGCHPHVRVTYVNKSGHTATTRGKTRTNGAFEGALWAGYYKRVKYTDMWSGNASGSTILSGTHLRVGPTGKVLFHH